MIESGPIGRLPTDNLEISLVIGFASASFVLSYLGVGAYRLWAQKRRILDLPNERSSHDTPMPRGGGLIIVLVTLAGVWLVIGILDATRIRPALLLFTFGSLVIAGVSWLDDLRRMPNWIRFSAHLVGAGSAILAFGHWEVINLPFLGTQQLGWGGTALAVLWIVGLVNAYNFMDGIDGLAGSQAVIAGAAWAIIGWNGGDALVGCLGLFIAATSLGFLGHNWPPANVFMGDVGSSFLGFSLAVLALMPAYANRGAVSGAAPLIALLLVWPFVFDTSLTFVRRFLKGENVFRAHRTHLYQRLVGAGWAPRSVTLVYVALALSGLLLARIWTQDVLAGDAFGILILPLLCLSLYLFVAHQERDRSRPIPSVQGFVLRHRRAIILFSQIFLLILTYYCSFLLRLDLNLQEPYRTVFLATLPIVLLIKLPIFYFFRLFRGWWRYVGMSDLLDIIKAALLAAPLLYAAVHVVHGFSHFPRSVFIIDPIMTVIVIGGSRFAVRAYNESARLHIAKANTLIIGAGRAGSSIARELQVNEKLGYNLVGFVDDDRTKNGIRVQGAKVLGATEDLPRLISENDIAHILIAIPSATGSQIQRVVDKCRACNVDFKTLPAIGDIIDGSSSLGRLRNVRLEDLLVRKTVRLDLEKIRCKLEGKVVFVTGAAGSIGSELVRQIAAFKPAKLVSFDRSESDLFKIDLDVSEKFPSLKHVAVVGDILDVNCLREALYKHRPHSVFHAAAYKHVPMMEKNCFQAVTNNIFGTYNVALLSRQLEVEDFVMISSDKAVNPGNIMGVTKRVAELLILGLQHHTTRFVSVRFGNVLGSRGSVIPLFEQQISGRQPVTVTHPDARRYFMTIHEAVQLVLQASTMGNGGEIFVLDMGEPVRIDDLARSLIRLSGLEPDLDIPVVYTGLRPGEKLFEELKLDGEGIKPTAHEKIRVLDGGEVSFEDVGKWLDELTRAVDSKNVHELVTQLRGIVPEYMPSQEILLLCEVDRHDRSISYNRARTQLRSHAGNP